MFRIKAKMAGESEGQPPDNLQPPVVENLLLSVAAWWRLTMDKNTVIDLIGRNFQQDDIISAMEKIKKFPGYADMVGEVKKRHQSDNRSATSAQAKDLVELLAKMSGEKKRMRFVINCEDLNKATSIMGGARGEGRESGQCPTGEPGGGAEEGDGGCTTAKSRREG